MANGFSTLTRLISLTPLLFILFGLATLPTAYADINCPKRDCLNDSAGEFELTLADGSKRRALLLDTEVVGDISGMVASINIAQNFKNDTGEWLSGRYIFPLPEGAAIDKLKIQIGDRVVKGVVQEKKQAQKTYQRAKKSGKKAGLLKQHRANLFSVSVANIAPEESISVLVHYVDRVRYENQAFSMRFPTTITPRYIPGTPLQQINDRPAQQADLSSNQIQHTADTSSVRIDPKTGWAANTDWVNDANDITPPQEHARRGQITNLFSFRLSINAGLTIDSISSKSHAVSHHYSTDATGKSIVEVSLTNALEPMNSDLLLEWRPRVGTAPQTAFFQQKYDRFSEISEPEYYSMVMLTPPVANYSPSLPRDITFIIDSSGSMAGTSIQSARQSLLQALQYLHSYDRFNVVDFDSQYRPLFPHSQSATYENIRHAELMINQLKADGGTEMYGAVNFSLSQPKDESYLRQIIFITDGSIGNEHELFALIKRKLGNARLFTVGIGSAPNTYFMTKAAKFGKGSFTYVSDLNEAHKQMEDLFHKIKAPKLRNIKIDWSAEVEQYPRQLPDMYAGEPILVIAKSKQMITRVSLSGQLVDQTWQQAVEPAESYTLQRQSKNLNTLWARHKIQSLMGEWVSQSSDKSEIQTSVTRLGLAHQLVTKFTSFVAVEEIVSRPQDKLDEHHNVVNLMPRGSSMPAPQTATARDLYMLIGLLLLLIASLASKRLPAKRETTKPLVEFRNLVKARLCRSSANVS